MRPPTVEDGPFRMIGTILEPILSRPHITGRHHFRQHQAEQAVKGLGGDGKLIERPYHENPRLRGHRTHRRWRKARSRRHRRHCRLTRGTVADTFCDPPDTPLNGAAIDPPDRVDVVHRQQLPLAGTEGEQGHEPHDPRPLTARGEGNVALRVTEASTGFHGSLGPRRIAARDLIETMRREGFGAVRYLGPAWC